MGVWRHRRGGGNGGRKYFGENISSGGGIAKMAALGEIDARTHIQRTTALRRIAHVPSLQRTACGGGVASSGGGARRRISAVAHGSIMAQIARDKTGAGGAAFAAAMRHNARRARRVAQLAGENSAAKSWRSAAAWRDVRQRRQLSGAASRSSRRKNGKAYHGRRA